MPISSRQFIDESISIADFFLMVMVIVIVPPAAGRHHQYQYHQMNILHLHHTNAIALTAKA